MNEITINKFELPNLEIKDYDKILELAKEDTEKYKNYVVTSETLESDTKKRAELRNYAKKINARRLEIEKEISKPIKEFKSKCDAIIELYNSSADLIDEQVKVFETKEKENKRKEIETIYEKLVSAIAISNLINLEMLFDERYLNKTYKLEDIELDLNTKITKISNDIEAIKNLNSEYEVSLTSFYLKNFDLSSVLAENKRLQKLKKETEKTEVRKEEIKEEKINTMLTEKVVVEEVDPVKTYTLRITAELSKQKKLKEFLELNNMKFERVD